MSTNSRIKLLKAVLPASTHTDAAIAQALGVSPAPASSSVTPPEALVQQARLANAVADISDGHEFFIKRIIDDPHVTTLRDVALRYDSGVLHSISRDAEAAASKSASPPRRTSQLATDRTATAITTPSEEEDSHIEAHGDTILHDPVVSSSPSPSPHPLNIDNIQQKLFHAEPSAIIQRLVSDNEIHLPSETKTGVVTFLESNPAFNIKKTSVVTALQDPKSLENVPVQEQPQVTHVLKTLQRVQSLATHPDHVAVLANNGIRSAHQVSQIPKAHFIQRFQGDLSIDAAAGIHEHALVTASRNEQALLQLHNAIKGTGIAAIDGPATLETRMLIFKQIAAKNRVNINLEALFGSLDYCECDDCETVYSPANYYVDLLQYLRNNNLDPTKNTDGTLVHPVSNTIEGTVLEVLLKRRPDLQHLLLTCENTNTLIPYIDLANEVMESFVVHLDEYPATWNINAQSDIDVHNVEDETSDELLAEPQHTNYKAYCILRQAVSPLSALPFHQPIEAIRIYLNFLNSSRYQLLDLFRKPFSPPTASPPFAGADVSELAKLHDIVINRATTAEFLQIIPEEYVLIVKEAFWPKEYFDITTRRPSPMTLKEYEKQIGVRETRESWGYHTDAQLKSDDILARTGLCFVKAQMMKRAQMDYVDVVNLVVTRFVNPFYPKGKDLLILQSIQFSFRFLQFLQRLVLHNVKHKKEKFAALVTFLYSLQPWLKASFKSGQSPDKATLCSNISLAEVCSFVYRWFDCIGKIVVLESGETATLPVYGRLVMNDPTPVTGGSDVRNVVVKNFVPSQPSPSVAQSTLDTVVGGQTGLDIKGTLFEDGSITDSTDDDPVGNVKGNLIGFVGVDGKIYNTLGKLFFDENATDGYYSIYWNKKVNGQPQFTEVGMINKDSALERYEEVVTWNPVVDDCNIDKVRLQHLDGSPMSLKEWDRIQQFVRLWKRLGCTIDELDHAIVGWDTHKAKASVITTNQPDPNNPLPDDLVNISDIAGKSDCKGKGSCVHGQEDCTCNEEEIPPCICDTIKPIELNPDFLDQFVNIKKIRDLLDLDLITLLALWDDISTSGNPSLYSTLFLTHNLLGIDTVFKLDANDNALITPTKITDHIPVIMAAFKLKQIELQSIMDHAKLNNSDLTLQAVSMIYRHVILAKALSIKPSLLILAISIFGDPFTNAEITLEFINKYNRFTNAGFSLQQLCYVIQGTDDPVKPLGPKLVKILKTTKTILDGLASIQTSNPDFPDDAINTMSSAIVEQKAGLIFDQPSVQAISALLQGTSTYTMAVPVGLAVNIPDELSAKIKYIDVPATSGSSKPADLIVTGTLTPAEVTKAKALSSNSSWSAAIDRAGKKALAFFNATLAIIFNNKDEAIGTLLAGDVAPKPIVPPTPTPNSTPSNAPPSTSNPVVPQIDPGTAPGKELYFLQSFMPYLRDQLADQLIISTMESESGISQSELTKALLTSILTVDGSAGESPLQDLRALANNITTTSNGWTGYLIPATTDTYSIVGFGLTTPAPVVLNGEPWTFDIAQDDPEGMWWTSPKPLVGGILYTFDSGGQSIPGLQWKTTYSQPSVIPGSALLPNDASEKTNSIFVKLAKAAIVVNGLSLTLDEVEYFQSHNSDFSNFDLNTVKIDGLERIIAYETLKSSLPASSISLLDVFKWASSAPATKPPSISDIASKLSTLTSTLWNTADIEKLIGPQCYGLGNIKYYVNEITLIKLQTAFAAIQNIGIEIPVLFKWADPLAKFWPTHTIAEDMRKRIRSRYNLDEWEKIVAPLQNNLRMKQRDALIAYLIVQKQLIEWGVVDADSLFEFFLIDVQMGACLKTSRIKQAISTVQTFIQRCFLGLETGPVDASGKPRITSETLDRDRWQWMQKQTLWTANMKVLVNPESYLVASLRDDKSPIYLELENELKQKDVNAQTLQDSFKKYISDVDTVSNLFAEGLFEDPADSKKLYIVARTRSSPYLRFYRTYSPAAGSLEWSAWQPLPVDIQTYHVDPVVSGTSMSSVQADGNYVIPIVFQRRLIVFFAQITPFSMAPPGLAAQKLGTSTPTVSSIDRLQSWKIQLAWSELRNQKWQQKQLTSEFLMEIPVSPVAPPIDAYLFVPAIKTDETLGDYVQIAVFDQNKTCIGGFQFQGSQAFTIDKAAVSASSLFPITSDKITWDSISTRFHLTTESPPAVHSLQCEDGKFEPTNRAYIQYPLDAKSTSIVHLGPFITAIPFYHPFANQLLTNVNGFDNLDKLFGTFGDQKGDIQSAAFGEGSTITSADGDQYYQYNELSKPYSIYNWEVGFHAPLELAEILLQSQQFDAALDICHYVFNPYASGSDAQRVWKWLPFRKADPENVIITLFNKLQPNSPDSATEVTAWRNNPYSPHVVARRRPVAYMKWTVMLYLKILIAYGDYYFRQNSLEAVPMALQLYILASHIYGPKAQKIPKRGKKKAQSYASLLNKWDAISNAVVDLELQFPFSNQINQPWGFIGKDPILANLFGFATTHYFDIPANPQLQALRDLIDDRLYKIRHCQDINGNTISLALWDPPIDPSILVAAVASGLSLSDILNDMDAPMPNYRFFYLLTKAFELCTELKTMANTFLSVKEKQDGEAMSILRATQDNAVQTMVMEIKNTQLQDSAAALEALETSRRAPLSRYRHYTKLAGFAQAQLTDTDQDYTEFAIDIPAPLTGELVVTQDEQNDMDEAREAKESGQSAGYKEVFAGACFAFPRIGQSAEPWGIGANIHFGPANIGQAATAHARFLRTEGDGHAFNSTNSGKKASIIKQFQDRALQADSAGLELLNISKQMVSQNLKIKMATQEIANQQKVIDNTNEVLEMLKNKYTNDQLYSWIEGSVRTLMYTTYKLAYDIAKKAETAFKFERGPQPNPFINFGYWDVGHDGLQSGERLYVALKQLESAYQEKRGWDFEITKPISLRQINPGALLDLRETGSCQFEVPEILFDMDFPGHYFRRIRSVTATIPCVVGPYTSINCTLRLLSHKYRVDANASDAKSYVEKTDGQGDARFSTINVPIDSIAVSSGQNDSGVFDFNLNADRYLPFEGAGAISKWQLDLSSAFRQFDYTSMTDVVLNMRYTSRNGGEKLKKAATDTVTSFITSIDDLSDDHGLFFFIDVKSEYASEWARAAAPAKPQPNTPPAPRTITLKNLPDRLPIFTRGRDATKLKAKAVELATATNLQAGDFALITDVSGNTDPVSFGNPSTVGGLKRFTNEDMDDVIGDWVLQITGDSSVALEKIYLIVRYTVGKS